MKTMLLAAAVLAVGTGAALADSEGGAKPNTQFTMIPGVIAQTQQAAPAVMARYGIAPAVFASQARQGTWLFAPQDGGGANN